MRLLIEFIISLGRPFIELSEQTGRLIRFVITTISAAISGPRYMQQLWHRTWEAGFFSLPVVGMTTLFSGMVLALLSSNRFAADLASYSVPNLVVLAITRELSPVLAGLMVSGRIGAAYAAEISTMRVSEQIDALITLSTPPVPYLIVPRIIAVCCMMPLLVLVGDCIGIFGGWLVSVLWVDIPSAVFVNYGYESLDLYGVFSGLVKAVVFGFIIGILSCYFGFHCSEGAQGVGEATTRAVVTSAIFILIANYFVTLFFFGF